MCQALIDLIAWAVKRADCWWPSVPLRYILHPSALSILFDLSVHRWAQCLYGSRERNNQKGAGGSSIRCVAITFLLNCTTFVLIAQNVPKFFNFRAYLRQSFIFGLWGFVLFYSSTIEPSSANLFLEPDDVPTYAQRGLSKLPAKRLWIATALQHHLAGSLKRPRCATYYIRMMSHAKCVTTTHTFPAM